MLIWGLRIEILDEAKQRIHHPLASVLQGVIPAQAGIHRRYPLQSFQRPVVCNHGFQPALE